MHRLCEKDVHLWEKAYFGVLDHTDSKFSGNHVSKTWLPTEKVPCPIIGH